jgi:hypothetical protein
MKPPLTIAAAFSTLFGVLTNHDARLALTRGKTDRT